MQRAIWPLTCLLADGPFNRFRISRVCSFQCTRPCDRHLSSSACHEYCVESSASANSADVSTCTLALYMHPLYFLLLDNLSFIRRSQAQFQLTEGFIVHFMLLVKCKVPSLCAAVDSGKALENECSEDFHEPFCASWHFIMP